MADLGPGLALRELDPRLAMSTVTSRLPETRPTYIWLLSRTQTFLTDQHMFSLHTLSSLVRTRE